MGFVMIEKKIERLTVLCTFFSGITVGKFKLYIFFLDNIYVSIKNKNCVKIHLFRLIRSKILSNFAIWTLARALARALMF